MAILSITFHIDDNKVEEWNNYLNNTLVTEIEKLNKLFLLSEVDTEMLSEGKNINLLLFFDSPEDRELYLHNTFPSIAQDIISNFQESVLIFKTFLNSLTKNI